MPIPSKLEFFVFEKFVLFTAKMSEGVYSKRSICKSKNLFFLESLKKSASPTSYAAKADTHLLSTFQGPTYACEWLQTHKNPNILYLNSSEILQMLIQNPFGMARTKRMPSAYIFIKIACVSTTDTLTAIAIPDASDETVYK